MINVLEALDESFHKSSIYELERYLADNSGHKKWSMFSDYCIGDDHKENDSIAFTIMPHDEYFEILKERIASLSPTDIKRKRAVNEDFISYLNEKRLFHIAFILKSTKGLTTRQGAEQKELIAADLDGFMKMLDMWTESTPTQSIYFNSVKKKLMLAKQELLKKSANFTLFREVILVPFLAGYISYLFTKLNDAKIFGWFSDRDRLFEAYNMLAVDLFAINHSSICQKNLVDNSITQIVIGDPSGGETGTVWYDELNRMPDHVAGVLADWNLVTNTCTREKFASLINGFFAVNSRLVVLKANIEADIVEFSRVTFHGVNEGKLN